MPAYARRSILIVILALVTVAFVVPSVATAQYKEFTGKIQKKSKKKFIVDNRQGDKVPFIFLKDTEVSKDPAVEGKKESVKNLKVNDWVTVSWKFIDKPRKAYKIKVIPPRREED